MKHKFTAKIIDGVIKLPHDVMEFEHIKDGDFLSVEIEVLKSVNVASSPQPSSIETPIDVGKLSIKDVKRVKEIIQELRNHYSEGIPEEEIISLAEEKRIDPITTMGVLQKLLLEGYVYSPKRGFYTVVDFRILR
ncbi:MAG: hypothetical protein ACXQS2_06915 [Methermicoccaceae archaeon]